MYSKASELDSSPIAQTHISITKGQISYVPLNPVADYVHILDLNTRPRVGWKTLPNLNFKLKLQTEISNSNLNFKTKIFPVLPDNTGF